MFPGKQASLTPLWARLAIVDINKDGWKDIYVTNDFYGSDLLYINNKDGTFTNQLKTYFKHSSQNAMGNDVADINNDGLADIICSGHGSGRHYRKKKTWAKTIILFIKI